MKPAAGTSREFVRERVHALLLRVAEVMDVTPDVVLHGGSELAVDARQLWMWAMRQLVPGKPTLQLLEEISGFERTLIYKSGRAAAKKNLPERFPLGEVELDRSREIELWNAGRRSSGDFVFVPAIGLDAER